MSDVPAPSPADRDDGASRSWRSRFPTAARVLDSTVGRLVIVSLLAAPMGLGALFLLLFAVAIGTGCFIECTTEPAPLVGLLLGSAASALVAVWCALLPWAVGRADLWRRTFVLVFGFGVLTMATVLVGG